MSTFRYKSEASRTRTYHPVSPLSTKICEVSSEETICSLKDAIGKVDRCFCDIS